MGPEGRDARGRMVPEVGAGSVKEQREDSEPKNSNTKQLRGVYYLPSTGLRYLST